MVSRNKLALGIGGTLVFLLTLVVLFAVLLPRLSNLQPVRTKILTAVSKEFGGRVHSKQTEITLLPAPQIIIRRGDLQLPGKPAVTFGALIIHIDMLPLLLGRVHTSELELEEPRCTLAIPAPSTTKPSAHLWSPAKIKERVAAVLAALGKRAPNLRFVVEKGTLTLVDQNRPVFQFHDLSAHIELPPKRLRVNLACKSNFCQRLRFQARFHPGTDAGQGDLHCQGLQPRGITDYFLPRAPLQVRQGKVNLDLSFHTQAFKSLQISVHGSIPGLQLHKQGDRLNVEAKDLAATVTLNQTRLQATLTRLDMQSPRMQSSGNFEWQWKPQNFQMKVAGKAVDVAAVRHAALFLMGGHDIVQKIFEIVRGGEVPLITFTSHGDTLHHLGKKENFILKGSLNHGEIFVPKANLELKDVQGKTIIANGILAGKDLSARLKNSTGDHGILRLGLEKHAAPFHLDIMVNADLSQVPPLLERFVKNHRLVQEVKLIRHAKGSARGRLILGENLSHIQVHTQISQFDLDADYGRVPYPIAIRGGQFRYAPDHIAARNLQVASDHCSFSKLSFTIDWAQTAQLKAQCQEAQVSLDEFYPWLLSFVDVRRVLRDFQTMKGKVHITGLQLRGPLVHPRQWQYRGAGSFQNYYLKASFLPAPLTLQKGSFQWRTKQLTLTDTQGSLLDATLNGSGSLHGYLYKLQGAELQCRGRIGPQALDWLDQITHLPADLKMQPPLTVAPSRFTWTKNQRLTFTGTFNTAKGPRVGLDLIRTANQLNIKKLSLKDQTSSATLTFSQGNKAFDVGFKGNLTHTTLDRLLVDNQFLTGWLKGDLQARILPDSPMDSVAQGTLQGAGLEYPGKAQIPVQLEQFSCKATNHLLTVQSAILRWKKEQMNLQGHVKFSPHGFVFDMGLSAAALDWDQIQKELADKNWGRHRQGNSQSVWDAPVQGVLRVNAKSFTYQNWTWKPCRANIFWGAKQLNVVIMKADLCGIGTPGVIKITPGQMRVHLTPLASKQPLAPTLSCLFGKKGLMNGNFDLQSEFDTKGKPQDLTQSLGGHLSFTAHDGRIFRFNILAKIFSVLNFTDIFVGRLPDLTKQGLGYRSITIEGDIQKGRLVLNEAVIDGDSIEIVSRGSIDLVHKTLDLTVLVAPLKTIDIILSYIPLLGDILGKIVSIPVQVTGSLDDPTVIPLSPAAVGSDLLGIMKSTLGLPLKIIQPILPK